MLLGQKIRAARKAQPGKLSEYDVAEALGVKRATYHAWESGQNQPPTATVKRIAQLWGIALEWFFDGRDTPIRMAAPTSNHKPSEPDEVRELPFDSLPKELQSLVRGDRVLLPLWRGVLGGDGTT